MSAHFQSSGPRSNAYSESKFTNWTAYDPFFAEARAVLKRFDRRIPQAPEFPYVFVLPLQVTDFNQACTHEDVILRLKRIPPGMIKGLRAVFVMAGTRKQQTSWRSSVGCYGMYWRSCVFLCAYPFDLPYRYTREDLRRYYLDSVLVHEIGHHVDRERILDKQAKEAFAHAFVQQERAKSRPKGRL